MVPKVLCALFSCYWVEFCIHFSNNLLTDVWLTSIPLSKQGISSLCVLSPLQCKNISAWHSLIGFNVAHLQECYVSQNTTQTNIKNRFPIIFSRLFLISDLCLILSPLELIFMGVRHGSRFIPFTRMPFSSQHWLFFLAHCVCFAPQPATCRFVSVLCIFFHWSTHMILSSTVLFGLL